MAARFSTTCFHVTDLERSIAFYRSVASLIEVGRWEPEGMTEVALRPADDAQGAGLMLMWRYGAGPAGETMPEEPAAEARRAAGLPPTGWSRLILMVDDIEVTSEAIRAAGGKAGKPSLVEWLGVRISFAKDPDGYILELIEGDMPGL